MANTLSPFGFAEANFQDGISGNYGLAKGFMAYNASACYNGDALKLVSGKLAVATVTGGTGAAVAGIARSFSWNSIALQRRVWANSYPGNDSVNNADVTVHYDSNPSAVFKVQVNGGPIVQADIGKGINFATGTASSAGISGMSADYATLNGTIGTLPFVVHELLQAPQTDPATAYNLILVKFATLTTY